MPNFNSEIASLPFDEIIGGPLTAAINAQSQAASAIADYIMRFVDEDGKIMTVQFKYNKTIPGESGAADLVQLVELDVPILAIIPIPALLVNKVTIDFNVLLKSVEKQSFQNVTSVNFSAKGSFAFVKMSGSFSSKSDFKVSQQVDRTYTLNIHVEASHTPPAGLDKILTILQEAIAEKPVV